MAKTIRRRNGRSSGAAETKAGKFKRLAGHRVTKAVHAINTIGMLASRSYEWTPDQIKKIDGVLRGAIDAMAGRFKNPGASREQISI